METFKRRAKLKKGLIILVFSFLMVVGLARTLGSSTIAEAASGVWDSCPRGRVNCAYPGQCHSYIDTNSDSICDHSQSNPLTSSISSTPVLTITSTAAITDSDTLTPAVTTTAVAIPDSALVDTPAQTTGSSVLVTESAGNSNHHTYYFTPIFFVIIALYSVTWILSVRKIIGTVLHRKIWNLVLLTAALISFSLGLFLTLNLDLGTNIRLPFDMLFWHVEAGIALGIVAVFHVGWHWRYFARILGVKNPSKDGKPIKDRLNEKGNAPAETADTQVARQPVTENRNALHNTLDGGDRLEPPI
jgi:hypothetical protein